MIFELRDYQGKVKRFELKSTYITLLSTCSSKIDLEHLNTLKNHSAKITELGFEIILIVHQNEVELQKSLKKKKYPFSILSDPKARIAKFHNRVLPLLGNVQRSSFLYNSNSETLSSVTFMSNVKAHFQYFEKDK